MFGLFGCLIANEFVWLNWVGWIWIFALNWSSSFSLTPFIWKSPCLNAPEISTCTYNRFPKHTISSHFNFCMAFWRLAQNYVCKTPPYPVWIIAIWMHVDCKTNACLCAKLHTHTRQQVARSCTQRCQEIRLFGTTNRAPIATACSLPMFIRALGHCLLNNKTIGSLFSCRKITYC